MPQEYQAHAGCFRDAIPPRLYTLPQPTRPHRRYATHWRRGCLPVISLLVLIPFDLAEAVRIVLKSVFSFERPFEYDTVSYNYRHQDRKSVV